MLKGQKKHRDKEQGKHEAPHSVNYRATQNKNKIGTTALDGSVVYSIILQLYSDTLYRGSTVVKHNLRQLMRLWHFSSSVNSFFKRACAAIQWG